VFTLQEESGGVRHAHKIQTAKSRDQFVGEVLILILSMTVRSDLSLPELADRLLDNLFVLGQREINRPTDRKFFRRVLDSG
jgi:hypothetical protein